MSSMIEISAKEAKILAANTIRFLDECRETRIQAYAKFEANRINNGFWHKLFKQKDVTPEEVIEHESQDHLSEINFLRNFEYGFQYETAKKILLATNTGKNLMLSLEDYRAIGP